MNSTKTAKELKTHIYQPDGQTINLINEYNPTNDQRIKDTYNLTVELLNKFKNMMKMKEHFKNNT
ncbi:DUF2963 domain-containing protein [Candidatus Phytoplasma sp. AldY-WA1]|uniref:DUF2963 domain-containing protein n=1 Tax=Candidatus Phytoplasma sp. AldY-WA1 TaxID=2852100 RepID=UPI00254B6ED5|nr:DUF2963 domain-containing protein [Candidatus Phytoplasma sp. AldY-WA1]